MDPLLTGATVGSIALTMVLIAIASRMGRNRARSLARVDALRTLVAESGSTGSQVLEFSGSSERNAEAEDEWDLTLREEVYDDEPEPEAPAAPAARAVSTTQQFVVHVPDAAGARPYQVSFEHKESRS